MIFVDVCDAKIKVSGETFCLNRKLGAAGFGFKFNKDKKQWTGGLSLKALEFLADQSGAILSPDARDELSRFRKAAQKRAAYMASRAGTMRLSSTSARESRNCNAKWSVPDEKITFALLTKI